MALFFESLQKLDINFLRAWGEALLLHFKTIKWTSPKNHLDSIEVLRSCRSPRFRTFDVYLSILLQQLHVLRNDSCNGLKQRLGKDVFDDGE